MNGCTWRGLPTEYGRWHILHTYMRRWAKAGVLERVFAELQLLHVLRVKIKVVQLDSTGATGQHEREGAPRWKGCSENGGLKLSGAAGVGSIPRVRREA